MDNWGKIVSLKNLKFSVPSWVTLFLTISCNFRFMSESTIHWNSEDDWFAYPVWAKSCFCHMLHSSIWESLICTRLFHPVDLIITECISAQISLSSWNQFVATFQTILCYYSWVIFEYCKSWSEQFLVIAGGVVVVVASREIPIIALCPIAAEPTNTHPYCRCPDRRRRHLISTQITEELSSENKEIRIQSAWKTVTPLLDVTSFRFLSTSHP